MPRFDDPLDRLANRINLAAAPSRELVDKIIATACTRLPLLEAAGKTRQFDEWCRSGAWVDAACALVAFELPRWSIRRIVRDDGVWLCSLSRAPNLSVEFDDVVEVSHEALPLAILAALVEAKRSVHDTHAALEAPPSIESAKCHRICCDNFS
jgi:hypothetical protein